MNPRHTGAAAFASILLVLAGCSTSEPEALGGSEAASTPPSPSRALELAALCATRLQAHASLRSRDIAEGTVRWSCADVDGVTGPDRGQERCEYHVVQNGARVRNAGSLTDDPVACVFTTVFPGQGDISRLKAAMADPANLGVAVADAEIVQMKHGFNARDVASGRVQDCERTASSLDKRLRLAACYQAIQRGGEHITQLSELCGRVWSSDSAWAEAEALGAGISEPGDPDFDAQRDLAACTAVVNAGTSWRNVDTLVCARASRAATECGCRFDPLPHDLQGLSLTGPINDEVPAGCHRAVVDGAPYDYLTICPVPAEERPALEAYPSDLGGYCRDRFAVDLVVKMPLRSLQKPDTCTKTPGFCSDYM